MEEWELAWLNCGQMPPQAFPSDLLVAAQDIAERWLFDARFRCLIEEWLHRSDAEEVLGGLLWSGFCLRGQPQKRVTPFLSWFVCSIRPHGPVPPRSCGRR